MSHAMPGSQGEMRQFSAIPREMEGIKVAIIEDDGDMRMLLERYLQRAGMTTQSYGDADRLDELYHAQAPQVVVLDVDLPGDNGFVTAARLRSRSTIGIIMLTGRTEREDRLLGLSMGVDHYLAKPVDLPELESVIRNLARRLSAPTLSLVEPAGTTRGWTLDEAGWTLIAPNGKQIQLSAAEHSLLLPLLESPGKPQSRDMINARLGKPRLGPDNRSLDVLISRMRRKIEETTGMTLPLRAARGAGYVFTGASALSQDR